jgi:hypothetical protein
MIRNNRPTLHVWRSVVIACVLSLASFEAAAQALNGQIYRIVAKHSGKVVDVLGGPGATGNGVEIQFNARREVVSTHGPQQFCVDGPLNIFGAPRVRKDHWTLAIPPAAMETITGIAVIHSEGSDSAKLETALQRIKNLF